MSASISTLPIWKKDSTAAEWLQELAACALANPERWPRIVVIFEELDKDGLPFKTRQCSYGIQHNTDILGTLTTAQHELFEHMKGRQ